MATGSEAAVAALPAAQKRAVFSHLATVERFFTGFAAYNSSSAASNLRIMAFTEGGVELGLFDTVLGPGQRIAELITNIIPGAADQNGGYVWAKSSQPLHFSSLFGSSNSTLLANVTPQPVPDGFLPDAGKPDFQIDPSFALVNLAGESSFTTQGGMGAQTGWSIEGEPGGSAALGEIDEAGNYDAPAAFPEPAGPLTVVAKEDDLVAAATLDLLELGTFNQDSIPGFLTQLAYVPAVDALYAILNPGAGGAVPAGQILNSVIEIEEDSHTTLGDLPGEEISDLLPFEASVGESFLLALSWTTDRIFRVDLETGDATEIVSGLDGPVAMTWNPVTGNLLVADENSLYSVSRVELESDLVSGFAGNGREKVALAALNAVQGLAADACSGKVFWTNSLGEIQSFDPVTGSVTTIVDGLGSPKSMVAVYRRDAGCPTALRLLIAPTGEGEVSLINPSNPAPAALAQVDSPEDLVFVPSGLGSGDSLLVASQRPVPAGDGPLADVVSVRAPDQHQSYATNVVGLGIPGSAADPLGDSYGIDSVQHDILDLSAYYDASHLHVTIAFAETISPCDEQCLEGLPVDALKGFLDLDLDRDATSGALAFSDLNSAADTGLGVEACAAFEFYDEEEGGLPIFLLEGEVFEVVGYVAVDFATHSVSFSIPLAMLGHEGPMNLAGVFGTTAEPTDVAPNTGFITSVPTQGDGLQASPLKQGSESSRNGLLYRRVPIGAWIGLRPISDSLE